MQQLFTPRSFDLDQRFKPTEVWLVRCLKWAADFHSVTWIATIELVNTFRSSIEGDCAH
jgi:hypothetical protein